MNVIGIPRESGQGSFAVSLSRQSEVYGTGATPTVGVQAPHTLPGNNSIAPQPPQCLDSWGSCRHLSLANLIKGQFGF